MYISRLNEEKKREKTETKGRENKEKRTTEGKEPLVNIMTMEDDFVEFIILILVVFLHDGTEGNSNAGCLSTQYVEIGRQGYISCTFPTQLSEVFWYDDVSGRSDVLAIAVYRVDENVKEGSGIDSGEYDILPNGTLVITNVTVRYEKQYEVLACTQSCSSLPTISVKVVVYPRAHKPTIASCNDESPCTVSVTKTGHPICQVDSARPPVDLEWMIQIGGKDTRVEGQVSFRELNSDGVTYKSFAVLNETINTERLLAVYICKARWIFAGIVTERRALVDYTDENNLLNLPLVGTVYYEINRRSELRCEVTTFSAIIWKKVGSSGTIETIGFMFEDIRQTNGKFSDDVILSLDGSLQFTSLQLHHEGTYVCIYDTDKGVKGTQARYLQVLVPPSPPYIKIQECQADEPCIFRGNRSGTLTCVINGVRPEVSLTWVSTNHKLVTLQNVKTVIQTRALLTDVSTSVSYEISHDIICGTSVQLKCEIGHPISQIIQPYATTVIYTDECTDHEDVRNDSHSINVAMILFIAAVVVSGLNTGYVMILFRGIVDYFTRKCHKKDPTSDNADENKIPLTCCNGNNNNINEIMILLLHVFKEKCTGGCALA